MNITFEHIWPASILFLSFLLTCCALLEPRYSRRTSTLTAGAVLLGILLLQTGLLFTGWDTTLVLTLLPLTAYLPIIVCLHALSKNDFLKTCAVWIAGLLVSFTLTFCQKLLLTQLIPASAYGPFLIDLLLLAVAAALTGAAFFFVRIPFREYTMESQGSWMLLVFPLLVVFLLLSYFCDSTADPVALILIFLTALFFLLTLLRTMILTESSQRFRKSQEAVNRQMALQRQEYEALNQQMELGRLYRHDLRHHLGALDVLLQQDQTAEASTYIRGLNGQLTALEQERWCQNATLNAVLTSSIRLARQAGCVVETDLHLSAELPFDEMDLCIVFSNALENAVHACQSLPFPRRRISLSSLLTEEGRLTISVKNPWDEPLNFTADGFPDVPARKGHGMGLRSVEAVTKKYNGLFQCRLSGGEFILQAVLFDRLPLPAAERRPQRRVTVVATAFLLCVIFLNCTPAVAQALEKLPVLGSAVRLVDMRAWAYRWGSSTARINQPQASGSPSAVQELNAQRDAWVSTMQDTFVWYVARKYEGYVGMDSDYTVLQDTDEILCLRFFATVNIGGSVEYNRCITLDKRSGEEMKLRDLFLPNMDYVSVLTDEVRRQMEEQMASGAGDYFLPGGIWPEEECFQSIDPDQNFYFDEKNLYLLFQEYEVAPGSMGSPQFTIALDQLSGLSPR